MHRAGEAMKAGDKVTVIGIPSDVRDQKDLQTRTLFEKCLGQSFIVVSVETVEGLPYPLAKLNVGHVVGEEPSSHAIWVEPEYLRLET